MKKVKEEFFKLLKELGYNATDNGAYEENFPWLMLRTDNYTQYETMDLIFNQVSLTLDIFSIYSGEKEILEILENITNNLFAITKNNKEIVFANLQTSKIIDDNSGGPIRKHGVATYNFIITTPKEAG